MATRSNARQSNALHSYNAMQGLSGIVVTCEYSFILRSGAPSRMPCEHMTIERSSQLPASRCGAARRRTRPRARARARARQTRANDEPAEEDTQNARDDATTRARARDARGAREPSWYANSTTANRTTRGGERDDGAAGAGATGTSSSHITIPTPRHSRHDAGHNDTHHTHTPSPPPPPPQSVPPRHRRSDRLEPTTLRPEPTTPTGTDVTQKNRRHTEGAIGWNRRPPDRNRPLRPEPTPHRSTDVAREGATSWNRRHSDRNRRRRIDRAARPATTTCARGTCGAAAQQQQRIHTTTSRWQDNSSSTHSLPPSSIRAEDPISPAARRRAPDDTR